MKTVEFKGRVTPNGQIKVPDEVMKQVPPDEQRQVVLVWGASEEESVWRNLRTPGIRSSLHSRRFSL